MSILFFHFDGTGNEPSDAFSASNKDESITNVLKSHLLLGGSLHRSDGCLSPHSTHRSFYYSGIGTYGGVLSRYLNMGFAFENADVASILRQALLDFQCHYHPKIERVVLIGFSRGAALARRFAALIDPFVRSGSVIEAVMDTVASIGWPNLDKAERPTSEVVFENGISLPSCVGRALHLVALDEQRVAFRPTLMSHDKRIREVWLPGVHSDVGGGYRQDGMADLSFMVMARWLGRQLVSILGQGRLLYRHVSELPWLYRNAENQQHWWRALEVAPKVQGVLHQQQRWSKISDMTLAPRKCHVLVEGQPCSKTPPLWHRSVYQRINRLSYSPLAKADIQPLGCWI